MVAMLSQMGHIPAFLKLNYPSDNVFFIAVNPKMYIYTKAFL